MCNVFTQTMLADRVAYYPRLVQLQNDNLIASFDNGSTGAFYKSTDNGKQLVCQKVDIVKKGFYATMANRSLSQFV